MPTFFKVKLRGNGFWVPDHPEIEFMVGLPASVGLTTEQAREALFTRINDYRPGQYTLEWDVPSLRKVVTDRINARTRELILGGFLYDGKRYSSSLEAQSAYNQMRLTNASSAIVNTLDDAAEVSLATGVLGLGNTLLAFLNAASAHVKAHRDSGTLLKRQARSATTIAQLLAIADNR